MITSSSCAVLWDIPSSKSVADATVLSFLTPRQEQELLENGAVKDVVTMSRTMDSVSADARALYLEIVADIGLFRMPDGRTLREALRSKGKASQWWYHPVAFRDSEEEPVYTNILSILAILREAEARRVETLYLVRPPAAVAKVLKSRIQVVVEKPSRARAWLGLIRGLLGRVRFLIRAVGVKLALNRYYNCPRWKWDVALQGFWDWSVFSENAPIDRLRDRYFGRLPDELRQRRNQVGYWCWYEPWNRPGTPRRSHRDILVPLQGRKDIVLLQSLLTLREVVAAALNFRSLWVFFPLLRRRDFMKVFTRNNLDLYPLFQILLLRGCVNGAIPQCLLVERAAERARARTEPGLVVCFQEHFPLSRALYAGLQGSHTRAWAVQHASYNLGKTFGALHARKEFAPQCDGQTIPHPDRICVMGSSGERLFRDCGYEQNQILSTGSTRYDHVVCPTEDRITTASAKVGKRHANVLIATSLPAKAEFQVIEASVQAIKGMEDCISLRLRQHPFDRMERQPGYERVAPWLAISGNSLKEDFVWADLVLVSQSTVGEEAFLAGKPVWQFRFPHPDQSALAGVVPIPRFYTVMELKQALVRFVSEMELTVPTITDIRFVYSSLFQIDKERPSVAIAEAISAAIQ